MFDLLFAARQAAAEEQRVQEMQAHQKMHSLFLFDL